jgi:DNA-binding NarL/FixJ family response regulator
MPKYLVVDDHPMIAEAMDYFVKKHVGDYSQTVITSCQRLEQWLEQDEEVDFILLDVNLSDGITRPYVESLLAKATRLFVYSADVQNDDVRNWINAGASGVISKSDSLADLLAAFSSEKGTTFLSHSIKDQLLNGMMKAKEERELAVILSTREKEVLDLVLQDKKNKEIAEELFISIKTVESHKRNIFSKYEVRSAIGLIQKLNKQ